MQELFSFTTIWSSYVLCLTIWSSYVLCLTIWSSYVLCLTIWSSYVLCLTIWSSYVLCLTIWSSYVLCLICCYVLVYGSITWTLIECLKKKLHGNVPKMLRVVWKKSLNTYLQNSNCTVICQLFHEQSNMNKNDGLGWKTLGKSPK